MRLVLFPFLIWLFSLVANPASDAISRQDTDTLTLQWYQSYPDDSIEKAVIGLRWALSYSGAMLPNAPYAIAVDGNKITIKLSDLGFDGQATKHLLQLHQKIKTSAEYQTKNSVDLGRYVALLLGAPEHYYRITGVPNKLDDLLSQYKLKYETGYVNRSNVSLVHRKIQFSDQNALNQMLMAVEIDSVSGQILEYETIEIMPNAQLRFGIYDTDGNRKNSASSSHSEAGKPAKCMWCHESKISQMFRPQVDVSGFLTYRQLQDQLIAFNQNLSQTKSTLKSGVDFLQTQQHTQTELLYISFMEPSAQRLALEWDMPLQQVHALLAGLTTHVHEEFKFLGNLYDRNAVETRAPFKGLEVSTHVREASAFEVNHLAP